MANNPVAGALNDLEDLIRSYGAVPGGLMPALHAVQNRAGYIDRALIPVFAKVFNITDAEVHGVISFYKDFQTTPPAGPVVKVCRGEACQSRGGHATWTHANLAARGQAVEVEEVFCLGNCALGPAVNLTDGLDGLAAGCTATSPLTA